MAGETHVACVHALHMHHIISVSNASLCLLQSLVVASISLQVANLYGYLRCKAVGQDGQPPPDSRSFTGQHLLQRVSEWLRHLACTVVMSTCQCTLSSLTIPPFSARHHFWNTMKITSSAYKATLLCVCLRKRHRELPQSFHKLHLLEWLCALCMPLFHAADRSHVAHGSACLLCQ